MRSAEVTLHQLQHVIGLGVANAGIALGNDMLAQVIAKQLDHEPLRCAADGGGLGEYIEAIGIAFERPFERIELAAQAPDTGDEPFLVLVDVRHEVYPLGVYEVGCSHVIPVSLPMSIEHAFPACQHRHAFHEGNPMAETNTRRAVYLTAAMMVIEIAGGWYYNSMALLADGWHMSSHALALGLSAFAYACARRYANDPRFAFGTWKIEILGGYSSAILLLGVAGLMAFQSFERLFNPLPIHYQQAIVIATVGLVVNLVCAWLLRDNHDHHHHGHGHAHGHDHGHGHHHDLNLRSAYIHVLADAATSVLAIIALLAGMLWGARWLDPVMGIAGAILVTVWAWGLLRDTTRVLLDAEMDAPIVDEIREVIAQDPHEASITDLHVWRVGKGKYAVVLGLATKGSVDASHYRNALSIHDELVHVTVELNLAS